MSSSSHPDRDFRRVLWLTLALFLSYLCVGMSLPVTSVFVSTRLGLGHSLAGLAVGIAFASTILSRGLAGRLADLHGGKFCVLRGLAVYLLAGLVCLIAATPGLSVALAYGVLLVGRLLLGFGESLALVGILAWCFGIMGPQRSGRVFALVGMGMYGAFAVGGPLGLGIFDRAGFAGVMTGCVLVPAIGLLMAAPVGAVAVHMGERQPFWRIIGRIWRPGMVVCLQGVGFAVIGAFMPLLFLRQGWPHPGLGLACFGGGFVLVRILCGHLPDRFGGIPVALVSIAVETAGQFLLWRAGGPETALVGAFLSGLGCSMIYPSMGVEVVRRIPLHLRGTAMGGFAAFQDLAYGLTGPLAGLLADRRGESVVFLLGTVAASLGFLLVATMARAQLTATPPRA